MKLDKLDLKIIDVLEENSRIPYRNLSKILGLTPMAAYKRVKRLEKLGVIKRYTILTDPDALGYKCNFYLLIRVKPGYDPEAIGKMIASFKETYLVNVLIGDYELAVITRCRDKEDIRSYISKIKNIDGVDNVNPYYIVKILSR